MTALRGSVTTDAGTLGAGRTVARPAGLTTDDVVVLVIGCETTTDPEFTCPGFTEVAQVAASSPGVTNVTVLAGTGQTAGGTFAISSSVLTSGDWVATTCAAFSDADLPLIVGTPYAASPGGTAEITVPGVTTTQDDAVVLLVGGQQYGSIDTPTGWTAGGSPGGTSAIRHTTQASAGATGDVTTTTGSPWQAAVAWVLAAEAGAAAPIDLTVADLTVVTTIDTVNLDQVHNLTVDDATVAVVIDAPTLSVDGIDLVVADTVVSSTIDAPTLTQVHQLTVDDLTVSTAVEAVTLAVDAIALTVDDVTVASTIDAPTLTQTHALTVADLAISSTIDTVALTQVHALTVAGQTVVTLIDTVTLLTGDLAADTRIIATYRERTHADAYLEEAFAGTYREKAFAATYKGE